MQLYTYKLSALDWKPVEFKVTGGDFELKNIPMSFSNGMYFNMYYLLSGIKDINFNSKTGILLSNLKRNMDVIKDKSKPNLNKELISIKTILTDGLASVYKHYSIFNNISGLELVRGNGLQEDEITIHFEDSYAFVEDFFGKCLTNGGFGESQIFFDTKSQPLNENQKWDYVLSDGIIMLFGYNTNYRAVLSKNTRNRLVLTNISPLDNSTNANYYRPPQEAYLYTISYRDIQNVTEINKYESVYNSIPVKYLVEPNRNNKQDLVIDRNSYLIPEYYYQDYLCLFPYENLNSDNTHDFYFHGLKNYQTYDYRYTTNGDHLNRRYNRIFSGTNQSRGTDKIYLNYISNKISLEFPADKLTEFYFTPTVDELEIAKAGFWENGASAGQFPYTSDRLYTKKDSNFADLPQLMGIYKSSHQEGMQYLCTWLRDEGFELPNSTTNLSDRKPKPAIWYDRFYNPAKYSQNAALTSTFMLYQDQTYPSKNLVYDVPSKLIFNPGVLYKYYHVGNKTASDFIKDLNYTFNQDTKEIVHANVLNVSSWDNTILTDHSYYNNYGLTFGNSGNFFGDYWSLDGSNYAIFQATPSLLPPENLTLSFWLKFDNWKNVNANQIFGNYYNSGFGLFNISKTISPLFTVVDNKSQIVYNFNINFNEASNVKTPIGTGDIIQRMPDFSYWVIDSQGCTLIKYDINNSIISRNSKDGKIGPIKVDLSEITQVESNSFEDLILYDNKSKEYLYVDKFGNTSGVKFSANQLANRIEIDLFNEVLDGTAGKRIVVGNCSVIDNDNNLWQVIGPNLYKEKNIIGTVGASNEMACDVYGNIWIVGEDDSYTKVDKDGNFIFRYSFKKTPLLSITNCPPSPPPEPPTIPVLEEELPFLSTNDLRYIITLPDFYTILVTPPKPKPKQPIIPITKRKRAINFINGPDVLLDETRTSLCGLSSTQINDKMVMVDLYDNQAYLINQLGQLELKLNFEVLNQKEYTKVDFRSGGDFTGYQHNRKFKSNITERIALAESSGKNISDVSTIFSWKWETAFFDGDQVLQSLSNQLYFDVSDLSPGWHHFCFTIALNQPRILNEIAVYIDSKKITNQLALPPNVTIPSGIVQKMYYPFRTSLNIGATTVKNTLLNNFLNIAEGYKMVGNIGDLKLYNYAIAEKDVNQLYLSSHLAPKVPTLVWEMNIGDRNYIEEISNWFKFQLPTHKTKYYNLNIHNLNIDDKLKEPIETAIKNVIEKFSPAHTLLNNINWMIPSKNKKNLPKLKEQDVSDVNELCPNRVTVIQICNSNAAIDDNFEVVLNGISIGDVILDQNALNGSYFVGSDSITRYSIAEPDFICPINNMRRFDFSENLISKIATNTLELINIRENFNGNLGVVQIRSYLKTNQSTLVDPKPITDLNYIGETGTSFRFQFNYICP